MRKYLKLFTLLSLFLIISLNIVSYNHAYKFTHFSEEEGARIKPEKLSFPEKIKILFLGIENPKPIIDKEPKETFEKITIQSHQQLEGWLIQKENHKGVVVLFHGYSSCKSGILNYGEAFNSMGYTTLLMDFMGSGGSQGNQTTIGFKESRDVEQAWKFINKRFPETPTILFGSSMGAVAIMKAVADSDIKPDKIIIECPFGTMRTTVENRFSAMNVPSFPFTDLLLFYGGLQNGFDAYAHNPIEYAKSINTPTLLLYGAMDQRVARSDIDKIYKNLAGPKKLEVLPNSGHANYLRKSALEWNRIVNSFLFPQLPSHPYNNQ